MNFKPVSPIFLRKLRADWVIPLWALKPSALATPSLADGQGLHIANPNQGERDMTTLFAQPYDFTANGFYFKSLDEYGTNSFDLNGENIEEYEIQFIDGEGIDCKLFETLNINQCNIEAYFNAVENWEEYQKINAIIAVGECDYKFDIANDDPDDFNVDLYQFDTMKELAEHFVEEGLYGNIPENIRFYLDYDAIARDLAMDYAEIRIDGTNYIYRCD